MSEREIPPQQGDEERLFERYDKRLRQITQVSIRTSPDIVDDACAFAWMKLLTHQPRRETAFAWLKVVARNEALRLNGIARAVAPLGDGLSVEPDRREPAALQGRVETAQGMLELRERLAELPIRQRELVFLNAAGWRYQDLAEREGISNTRVNQILSAASARMREMDIREHDTSSPRGLRLRSIESSPPQHIVAALGTPPSPNRRKGHEELRRDWRRLALAIEDFRQVNGITDRVSALGTGAGLPGRDELVTRVGAFRRERGLSRGLER